MTTVLVRSYGEWRTESRRLLAANVAPDRVLWVDGASAQSPLPLDTDGSAEPRPPAERETGDALVRVPKRFVELAALAALHRSGNRWRLLYVLLWRLRGEGRGLLDVTSDSDVHAVEQLAAQVRRDEHKMRAFVRFTPVSDEDGERFVAYYEPDHLIVRRAAPFFADRFSSMRWSILTPDVSAHWDGRELSFSDGVAGPPAAVEGEIEELWRTYYAAVFNPARVNIAATLREMPRRRWSGLPEARMIPSLVSTAHERTKSQKRAEAPSARPFVPEGASIPKLRDAAAGCRGCDLYIRATRVVFGEGREKARLVLIGEQPGDAEDRAGQPFVGPAGQVLDRALTAAGIERSEVYVTNAVKHFSFEERGKRRIHKTPRISEVRACRPWLEAELQRLRPDCIVCMGSTAARTLLGPQAKVMDARGSTISGTSWAESVYVTIHPSAVLRADDSEAYFRMLVDDLTLAARHLGPPRSRRG